MTPRREVFAGLLDYLDTRIEIDVRVQFDQSVVREVVRHSHDVRRPRQTVKDRSAEGAYPHVQLGEQFRAAIGQLTDRTARELIVRFGLCADDVRLRDPSHHSMLLNAAFLVQHGRVEQFRAVADAVDADPRLLVRIAGPMPPYSFADVELGPHRVSMTSHGSPVGGLQKFSQGRTAR